MRKINLLMSSVAYAAPSEGTRAQRLAAKRAAAEVANVFRDGDGVVITEVKDIVATYGTEVEIPEHATDEQVMVVLNSVRGDDSADDVRNERINALTAATFTSKDAAAATVEPIPVKRDRAGGEVAPLSAIPFHRVQAIKLGAMLDDGQFGEHMKKAADAKEDFEGSALLITGDLERLFGEERDAKGKVTRESMLKDWPIPGSGTKAWIEKHGTTNNPDHYEVTASDGSKIKRSFTGDIWDSTKEGKYVAEMVRHLKDMQDNKGALLTSTPKEFHYLAGDVKRIAGVLKKWNARRNNPLTRFRKAVAFVQAKEKLREFPGIALRFIERDPKTGVPDMERNAKLGAPILLQRTEQGFTDVVSDAYSLSSFINLKWDEFAKLPTEEQTMPALVSLSRRAKRIPGTGKADNAEGTGIRVRNVKDAGAAMSALNGYFEDDGAMGSFYTAMNRNGDDKNMMLDNIESGYTHFHALHTKYKPQIEVRQKELFDAENAEAKAKLTTKGNGGTVHKAA